MLSRERLPFSHLKLFLLTGAVEGKPREINLDEQSKRNDTDRHEVCPEALEEPRGVLFYLLHALISPTVLSWSTLLRAMLMRMNAKSLDH